MSQISQLVEFAIADTTKTDKKISLGVLSNLQSQEVGRATGIVVRGLPITITADRVRHVFSSHGNHDLEQRMGNKQIGVKAEDFEYILEILKTPDLIERGSDISRGQKSIKFSKKLSSGHTYVVVMGITNNDIRLGTMYIKQKATP